MMLSQALRYPFQEKGWFRRTLILTLVQFLPVVGQLIYSDMDSTLCVRCTLDKPVCPLFDGYRHLVMVSASYLLDSSISYQSL